MNPSPKHVAWIDLLRVVACFLVVFSHCCDPFVARFESDPGAFLTGVLSGSLVRCCVPLFVMMTGVLLLPVKTDLGTFYRRRIGRLALPLLFWSLALPLLFYVYLNGVNPATQNPAIAGDHTWPGTVNKLWTFVFNFNFDTTPLWYLYMLVGLYFVIPIFGSWLERAERREIRLLLWIWGASLLLPYVEMVAPLLGYTGNYGNTGIFGICDWNKFGTFYYVSGFIGYVVLAYYLKKYPPAWSWRKTWAVSIPMFVAGYLVTALGFLAMQCRYPGNYAYLEIIWYFAGINVFMMTFPIFLIFRRLEFTPRQWLSQLAGLTFGIYLCHFILVEIAYDLFDTETPPDFVRILCMAVSAFAASAGVVWLLQRSDITRKLVA